MRGCAYVNNDPIRQCGPRFLADEGVTELVETTPANHRSRGREGDTPWGLRADLHVGWLPKALRP